MGAKARILIVEDDPITAKVYRSVLQKHFYDVAVATSPQIADLLYSSFVPDLILLDYMLPGMNGIQWFQQCRKEGKGKTIPVILYSSAFSPALVLQAQQSGIPLVLDKAKTTPAEVAQIIATLLPRFEFKPFDVPVGE